MLQLFLAPWLFSQLHATFHCICWKRRSPTTLIRFDGINCVSGLFFKDYGCVEDKSRKKRDVRGQLGKHLLQLRVNKIVSRDETNTIPYKSVLFF